MLDQKVADYVEKLIEQELPAIDIQAKVKEKFDGLDVAIGEIRTVHAGLCDKRKHNFVCAGLFEE